MESSFDHLKILFVLKMPRNTSSSSSICSLILRHQIMASLAILVKHSGKWDNGNDYVDYNIDAIVLKENASFLELYKIVAIQIGIDESMKMLKIEYKVEQSSQPMLIRNDMGVRVYVLLKKSTSNFNKYPICVSIVDESIMNNDLCPSSFRIDGGSGTTNIRGIDEFERQQLTIAELVEPLGAFVAGCYDGVISDPCNKFVEVDQVYKNKATLKSVMDQYTIAQRFSCRTTRSNSISYTLECYSENCEWLMKASNINKSGMFRIRAFNKDHTCALKDRVYSQKQATSNLIGGIIKPKFVDHKRKYTANDIKNDVKSDLGVDVTYMTAWRAKEKALISLRGTPAGSYGKLPGYLYMMGITYPGSHIQMKKNNNNQFLYVFIALNSSIQGFNHCRPVVVVDGSHLRGTYNGIFVAASTMDGAGHILPLAYGVIDSENDASWSWFFEQLKVAYGERSNLCVVSDRNESIIKAVTKVYKDVPHYACMWHLWGNVQKRYRKSHDKLTSLFYTMAKACTQSEFDRLMETVEKVDVRVKDYLESAGYDKWARCHATAHRGWAMTSNIAESINAALVSARELPIFDFLEQVRLMFGRWNHDNKNEATCTFTPLIGKFQEILTVNEAMSTRMRVVPSTEYVHNVNDDGRNFVVCLQKKTCTCGRFQYEEIPCEHAWAVLKWKHLTPDEYCSDLYKPKTVLKIYEIPIYPLPDESEWIIPDYILDDVVLPPIFKRLPGRPKKKIREKQARELLGSKGKNTCSTCGVAGHNRRSCRNKPQVV